MIQQIRGELPIDGVDLNDAQAVKKAQERLKSELPFFCPHYGMFKNNVRRQEAALPESFLFQTIIDVDDKEYVEKAIEKARELNCSSGVSGMGVCCISVIALERSCISGLECRLG